VASHGRRARISVPVVAEAAGIHRPLHERRSEIASGWSGSTPFMAVLKKAWKFDHTQGSAVDSCYTMSPAVNSQTPTPVRGLPDASSGRYREPARHLDN
jgi:hypothetical protein